MGPDPLKPGELLTAEWLNALAEEADGPSIGVAGDLEATTVPGQATVLRGRKPMEGWWKITGAPTSGNHPAKRLVETASGTFVDSGQTGTIRDTNGSTRTLTNVIVWASKRRRGGTWWFQAGDC